MSETFPQQVERLEHEPRLPAGEHHRELPERGVEAGKHELEAHVAAVEARKAVAEIDQSSSQLRLEKALAGSENKSQAAQHTFVDRQMKALTYNRELRHVRRHLAAPERALSQIIHQPAIRAVSAAAAESVSRPSGLLGGGMLAFAGTTVYLYLAKHLGFTYNYFVFLALLAAGFGLGLTLELAVHMALRRRSA